MQLDPLIPLSCSLVLSYIFVVASFHKWQNLAEFRETLVNYQLMPEDISSPLVYVIPVIELLCGIGLLVPHTSAPAALLSGLLLIIYMFAIGINLLRGRRTIDCGCGASDQKQGISEWLLLRNTILVFFSYCVVSATQSRELFWLDWLVALLATAVVCLIYNIINQLLVNKDLLKVLKNHG